MSGDRVNRTPRAGAPDAAIRPAASLVLLRDGSRGAEVLTGRRATGAAVLPDRRVFPGGAVDAGDAAVPLAGLPGTICLRRLGAEGAAPQAFAACAIRELWEETGLAIGRPGRWPGAVPPDWSGFADLGLLPDAATLIHVFRAITPANEPRRFDARFFVAWLDERVSGELGRLPGGGQAELEDLRWQPLADVDREALAFITEVVLAEIAGLVAAGPLCAPPRLPIFENRGGRSEFLYLP